MNSFNTLWITAIMLLSSIYSYSQQIFTAPLSPNQEVHDVSSNASGLVTMQLTSADSLIVEGQFTNLTSSVDTTIVGGAHIHLAPAGQNGPVVIPLNLNLSNNGQSGVILASDNRFRLDASQKNALQQRQWYINIHSLDFTPGELRGQVVPKGPQIQYVSLSGDQQVPSIMSQGSGAVIAEIYSDSLILSGSFSNLQGMVDTSIAGGIHVHSGQANENGPIAFLMNPTLSMDFKGGLFSPDQNAFSIDNNERVGLTLGSFYVNIHSTSFPSGEIRGQLGQLLNAETYRADLTGRQEVHTVRTTASGGVDAMLVDDLLIVSGSFSDLQAAVDTNIVGGAHIHMGLTGSNGPVVFPLDIQLSSDGTAGEFAQSENAFVLTPDQKTALEQREFYINIHSRRHAAGELRGQLLPESDSYYFIKLQGSQEVPTAMTTAQGALSIEFKDGELIASGSFQGLRGELATDIAGGMHLHEGRPGTNGPVLFPINVLPSMNLTEGKIQAASNRFELDMGQERLLSEKMIYANLHSSLFPGGEIRGQIADIKTQILFRAYLSGMNEIPAALSAGNGQVVAEWQNNSLLLNGTFQNLSSEVATEIAGGVHLHQAMAGQNGPVQISLQSRLMNDSLAGIFSPMDNTFTLSTEESMSLINRQIYLNIHTRNIPSGELRGQMLPESQIIYNAQLLSSQAVPNAKSFGIGGLSLELNDDQLSVSGSYANLSSAVDTSIVGGFHIHAGLAGQTGPVEFVLQSDFTDGSLQGAILRAQTNQFTLNEEQLVQLMNRAFYTNLHTQNFTPGELRGQVLPEATTYFYAPLSGVAQVPSAVNTSATGMAILELTGNQSRLSGSFSNLSTAVDTSIAGGIHIHENFAGSNGPVIKLIQTDFTSNLTGGSFQARQNAMEFMSSEINSLIERGNYINIHSRSFAAGEIRGQLLPPAQIYLRSTFNGLNEVQPIETVASGGALLEVNDNRFVVSGSFDNLQSPLDRDIAGGVHIHEGNAGENGGIEFLIATTTDSTGLNGVFETRNNEFEADEIDLEALIEGGRYFNIHSENFAGGELRGQIVSEINFFPTVSPNIISPADGSELVVEGDTSQTIDIQWNNEGTDENEIVYLWELALDASFDTTIVLVNVGFETRIELSYGQLNNLLESLDITSGDELNVFHRVITSDGSVMTAGQASQLTLQNGTITSTENISRNEDVEFTVFPTVSSGRVQIQLTQQNLPSASAQQEIEIRNALGQIIDVLQVANQRGDSRDSYQFGAQPSGMYFFNWKQNGQLLSTQKVILE